MTFCVCPLCEFPSSKSIAQQPADYEYRIVPVHSFTVMDCGECGSQFLWPRPSLKELCSFYPEDYHAHNEDHELIARILVDLRVKARHRIFQRLVPSRPIHLFDVGTGDCRQFDALSFLGEYQFAGVELSPRMVRLAISKGYNVAEGSLEEMNIATLAGTFDIVTMYQLVEHVLEPRLLLQKANKLLKPGGYVLGQLPCINSWEKTIFGRYWAGYHYPRHLQMISRNGLAKALQDAGYTNIKITSALHLQASLSLQNVLVDLLVPQMQLRYGKISLYSLLQLTAAPFCFTEHMFGKGGMMNFIAKRPY